MPSNYYDQPVAQQQDFVNRLIANNWRNKFAKPLALGLAITITISLAIYGLVRAIGIRLRRKGIETGSSSASDWPKIGIIAISDLVLVREH
jgi:hypothetical protein